MKFPLVGWVTREGAFIEEVGDETNLTEIKFETQEELDWFNYHDCRCAYNYTCTSKCEIYDYEEEE